MQNRKIDGGKPFDWGCTSDDYAKYRDIYPPIFYKKFWILACVFPGKRCWILAQAPGYCPAISITPAPILLG